MQPDRLGNSVLEHREHIRDPGAIGIEQQFTTDVDPIPVLADPWLDAELYCTATIERVHQRIDDCVVLQVHKSDRALTFDKRFVPRYLGAKAQRERLHLAVRRGIPYSGSGAFRRAGGELSAAEMRDTGCQFGDWMMLAKSPPKRFEVIVLALPVGHGDIVGA